jgi:hypothetical protein
VKAIPVLYELAFDVAEVKYLLVIIASAVIRVKEKSGCMIHALTWVVSREIVSRPIFLGCRDYFITII